MKRLILFLVMFVSLFIFSASGFEVYQHYGSRSVGASVNTLFIPKCEIHGDVQFRPNALQIWGSFTLGSSCSLTIYIPADKGPRSATDSFVVFISGTSYNPILVDYRSFISDTMRVGTGASSTMNVYAFKRER